jgi:hypothetical protein
MKSGHGPMTRSRWRAVVMLAPTLLLVSSCRGISKDDDASVAFSQPSEGADVAGGVELAMTADGITIEEAGEVHDDAGHFHVVADEGCVAEGEAVPRDADHVHFGGGQSEGTIYLAPGEHELCLQVGDGAHVALAPSDTVTVRVGVDSRDEWCAVVREVDERFTSIDNGDDDFPARQVAYEGVRRLLAQLSAALDQVDAEARDDVAASIDTGTLIVTTFIEAPDFEAAGAALEAQFGPEGIQSDEPGAMWIADNCDVDIDG